MERFTRYVPCEFCDAEIFATRVRQGNTYYWANRDDLQPHSCEKFRNLSVQEVEAWQSRMRRRAYNYRPKRPSTPDNP